MVKKKQMGTEIESISVPIIPEVIKPQELQQSRFKHKNIKTFSQPNTLPSKLEAIIIRYISGIPVKIGSKKIKSYDTSFRFLSGEKAVTFIIPNEISQIGYVDGKTTLLFYDFDSGQLTFHKNRYPMDVKFLDIFLTKNAIAGIFNRLRGALEKESISGAIFKYLAVLGLGSSVGGILGYIIGHNGMMVLTLIRGIL